MRGAVLPALALPLLLVGAVHAETRSITITVTAGKQDCKEVPVCVPLELPAAFTNPDVERLRGDGFSRAWQLTTPGVLTEQTHPSKGDSVRRDLHFIIPELKAGQSLTLTGTVKNLPEEQRPGGFVDVRCFEWKDVKGQYADLVLGIFNPLGKIAEPRPVMRYMYRPYDPAKGKRELTYKVFHHLYDPAGKRFVTNGGQTDPGAETTKLTFPHHRGLMYAFNKITYDGGKQADTWHAKPKDTHEEHAKFLQVEAGPVLGRHRVLIDWRGPENDVFAREERELTVYNVPGGTLVEFASRLQTVGGKVKLDGDPQHAGFQFRASNDVAARTAKQTYYLRPDGKDEPGKTRNWPGDKQHVDLPWDALSFVLDGKRYTVAYLNKPTNPRESRFSERDYGRFGCYFEYELTKDRPLVLDYRVWLQEGEMTGPQVQALSTEFVTPPQVSVK